MQSLGGEDFAWYLTEVPGAMGRLGTRTPGGPTYDLHQGDLVIDERAIGFGAKVMVGAVLDADGVTRRRCSTFRLGNVPHRLKHFRPGGPYGGSIFLSNARTLCPFAPKPKRSSRCASGDEVRGGHVGRRRGVGRVWKQLEQRRRHRRGRGDVRRLQRRGPQGRHGLRRGWPGDQSFNDAAAAGLDKAVKDLGVQSKEAAATNGEAESARQERLQQLIDAGYTNVVAVGFAYAKSVGAAAKANPNVKFAIVDDASPDSAGPNVDQITFAEEQGSFLVGAAAALKSKVNHIGFVGGVNTDLIKKFQAGYQAGAKAVNPNIVIDVKYLTEPPDFSGFNSVDKGKAAAEGMYQGGADIVYHAAGGSGGGVFTAAKAAGKLAIGVDSDQAKTAAADVRDVIMTSMIKKVDVGVYDFIKSVSDGSFKAGNKIFDLKAGGVDYSTTGGKIDDIKAQLDDYKAKIIAGTITVPAKP